MRAMAHYSMLKLKFFIPSDARYDKTSRYIELG